MRDLCQATGLERQTIHFYIQEGLLPEGKKTGRNMAYYGEDHLERLRLIKKLQEERFLPLRAIRAVLGGKSGGFSKEQRKLLADVKTAAARCAAGARPRG
jgi:DNA-binding transcriptional MerR regulator